VVGPVWWILGDCYPLSAFLCFLRGTYISFIIKRKTSSENRPMKPVEVVLSPERGNEEE
jgi:hypothetical protein